MPINCKYFLSFRQFFSLFILLFVSQAKAQHQENSMIYAPTEDWVKPMEKPYRDAVCLNGKWQFQPIELPDGFREGEDETPALPTIDEGKWSSTAIKIPSPWNVNSFAGKNQGGDFRSYPSYPEAWENIKMAWLKKQFNVPASWKGKRVQLHFEAVAGNADIVVNGKKVGSHFDNFLPFDVDITDAVQIGKENTLYVGVRKASLFDKKSEHGRRTYQAGSFWGQHIAGIWQDVFLVATPEVSITDAYIKPLVDKNTLSVELTLKNHTVKEINGIVNGDVYEWLANKGADGKIAPEPSTCLASKLSLALNSGKIKIPRNGETKVTLNVSVNNRLKLWSLTDPNLYGLVLHLQERKRVVDSKYERFGWRQTKIEGNRLLLNGEPLVLKGDSWHFMGIPQMTRRYPWAWYNALKDIHGNAVRLHAQPYPTFYLDMADEMGIFVLDETAVWASDGGPKFSDENYWKDSERHLSSLIIRDRNHPSVLGWSVSNEVMPVIVNVMRNPPGLKEKLIKYYGIWASICRRLDPTREWISADGEDDAEGKLPVYMVHYGGEGSMDRARKSGKIWGVGEAGNAYYGTPQQVAGTNGDRAYESFLGRMEGVALSSYASLTAQRERDASYRSVFNLAWYGLKPLAFGLRDTTKAPSLNDGVYFTSFKEGQPGVQPERLGPYTSTLNPGYDPALSLYETWPLFDAIRNAGAEPAQPFNVETRKQLPEVYIPFKSISSIQVIGGEESGLAKDLIRLGVPVKPLATNVVPDLLFVDGIYPPATTADALMDSVTANGGTVLVWGASFEGVGKLNALLPAPIEVTVRKASSLLIKTPSVLTATMKNADWYFSELVPAKITKNGLGGDLVEQSTVLLAANNTDWLTWNKQAEYAKTGMVIRSEREAKPDGAIIIWHKVGAGNLLVTTLPSRIPLAKAKLSVKKLLRNLGVELGEGNDSEKPLSASGDIVNTLVLGSFPISAIEDAAKQDDLSALDVSTFKVDASTKGKQWKAISNESGFVDFKTLPLAGPQDDAMAYLSFWISSPRSLEDLLIEPNMPQVNMEVEADDAVQVWLNGKMIIDNIRVGPIESGKAIAKALKLHQGWNHVLIKVIQGGGNWQFKGRITCSQPAFLDELGSALEKPM